MGYTHYFSYHPDTPAFRAAWPGMRADADRVLDRVEAAGIRLCRDPFEGTLPPEYEVIAFNGSMDDDLCGEPLVVAPRLPGPSRRTESGRVIHFCKTGRNPYDVAVATILLRCHRLLPDQFSINSDGAWDAEWWYGESRPSGLLSARGLAAELFGDEDPACPFDDDWARDHR
jgi:hypothetical protein